MKFSSKSMVDDFGRVFFQDGKVFRAINKKSVNYCIELIDSNLFRELLKKGLIPQTTISNDIFPHYDLVLEHERLLEIKQFEWSFEMLKRAALTVLEVNEICNNFDYELKDAHTFNILFRGINPVYCDIGSIAKRQGIDWIAQKEFICVYYIPLLFWSQNQFYIVRKLVESNFYRLLTAPFQDMFDSEIIKLLKDKPFKYTLVFRNSVLFKSKKRLKSPYWITHVGNRILSKIFERPIEWFSYEPRLIDLKIIKGKIESLTLTKRDSEWSKYHQDIYFENINVLPTSRFNRIIEIINGMGNEIYSVLDLAGNEGYFSKLLMEKTTIPKLLLTDYDSNAIDFAYNYFTFNSKYHNRVSIALLNFIFTNNIEDTTERFKSDLVVALAITHHLVLAQKFSLEVVFERISSYSNKYVIIEFMPKGLWSTLRKEGPEPPSWYNFEWFKDKFLRYFEILKIEILEENRILFCGKILADK